MHECFSFEYIFSIFSLISYYYDPMSHNNSRNIRYIVTSFISYSTSFFFSFQIFLKYILDTINLNF